MIQKARAIVLNSIKFQESSLISYCYSQEFGRISIVVNGAFSRGKRQGKSIFFQPFNVLDIVFYQNPRSNLNRLKEVEFAMYQQSIPFDPIKRSIALFLSEFIYRTVKEVEPNPTLYKFVESYIDQLDAATEGIANSHLIFLAQLTKHIGFMPTNLWSTKSPFFDYKNGTFIETQPKHSLYFDKDLSRAIGQLLTTSLNRSNSIALSRFQRAQIIEGLIDYYKFHLGEIFEINSLPILSTIFQ